MLREARRINAHEVIPINRDRLIYLPYEDPGYPNLPINFIFHFRSDMYRQNHRLFLLCQEFYSLFGTEGKKGFRRGSYPITKISPDEAIKIVEQMKGSPDSAQTLEELMGNDFLQNKLRHTDLKDILSTRLEGLKGNTTVLSPSHLTDYHLLEALAEKGVDLKEVGLVIFDQHMDGSFNKRDGEFIVDKSNFLVHAFEKGLGAVTIMGLDEEDLPRIKKTKKDDSRVIVSESTQLPESYDESRKGLVELQKIYEIYKDRLLLPDGVLAESRRLNKPSKVLAAIDEQVKFLKERGIKHVLISFDMDSLDLVRERITATPYSPFTSMVSLGIQDLTQVFRAASTDEHTLEDQIRRLKQIKQNLDSYGIIKKKKGALSPKEQDLQRAKKKEFDELLMVVYPVIYNMEDSLHSLKFPINHDGYMPTMLELFSGFHTINSDEGGFTLDQANFLLKNVRDALTAQGLEVGIPFANGKIMGTVSEIDGLDFEEKSAAAALRLVNMINSL